MFERQLVVHGPDVLQEHFRFAIGEGDLNVRVLFRDVAERVAGATVPFRIAAILVELFSSAGDRRQASPDDTQRGKWEEFLIDQSSGDAKTSRTQREKSDGNRPNT